MTARVKTFGTRNLPQLLLLGSGTVLLKMKVNSNMNTTDRRTVKTVSLGTCGTCPRPCYATIRVLDMGFVRSVPTLYFSLWWRLLHGVWLARGRYC